MPSTTKPVFIRTRTVGQYFGTCGQLVTVGPRSRQRVIAETRTYPYGFADAAHDGAISKAVELGLTVVDSDGTMLLRDGQAVRS